MYFNQSSLITRIRLFVEIKNHASVVFYLVESRHKWLFVVNFLTEDRPQQVLGLQVYPYNF